MVSLPVPTNPAALQLPTPLPMPGPWYASGVCHGTTTSVFYPQERVDAELGLAICRKCPVMNECRDYAREHRIRYGTWGGESEWERRRRVVSLGPRSVERVTYTGPTDTIEDDACPYCGGGFVVPGPGTANLCLDCKGKWPRAV